MPELQDLVSVTPEKNKEWEYKSPCAMNIFNKNKKTGSFGFASCQEMAQAIVSNVEAVEGGTDAIDRIELS